MSCFILKNNIIKFPKNFTKMGGKGEEFRGNISVFKCYRVAEQAWVDIEPTACYGTFMLSDLFTLDHTATPINVK